MKSSLIVLWTPILVLTGLCLGAAEPDTTKLSPQLELLRPLLGKTWKGTFANSKPDKPIVDVMRWERILNGAGVRVLHSVNDGSYGGETIYMWDQERQKVTYHYFTTAGFTTTGTMEFRDGKYLTHEIVSGDADTVTEVRATSEFQADGAFVVRTERLKNGKWLPGRETTYREDAAAQVIFR